MSAVDGVLFDLGGVVMDSPLHAIARYERDHGLPANAVNRVVATAGETGAWARLERGELTVATFGAPFEADCRAQGLTVDSARLMAYVAEAVVPRPQMLEAIRRIRAQGLRVGALTNNWKREDAEDDVMRDRLRALFDVFIESRVVGLHKPDPRIYTLACDALGVAPARTAFLDDIGRKLNAARALGTTTTKVHDPGPALGELGALLGFALA